jgi:hypothetical protein
MAKHAHQRELERLNVEVAAGRSTGEERLASVIQSVRQYL